ncbi:MAG: dephospho-CoA kinase, partial [Bacilli bacterium]|nr:dephospho-CoA kinase [Bacilli bacterium]
MNKIIGITGGMSSGKTTLCKKLIELNPDYIYIDVDGFRRSLYNNNEYIQELKSKITELKQYKEIDSLILNKYIYYDEENMNKYKETLYNYLFKYLNEFNNKTLLVDWALIVNDNL